MDRAQSYNCEPILVFVTICLYSALAGLKKKKEKEIMDEDSRAFRLNGWLNYIMETKKPKKKWSKEKRHKFLTLENPSLMLSAICHLRCLSNLTSGLSTTSRSYPSLVFSFNFCYLICSLRTIIINETHHVNLQHY